MTSTKFQAEVVVVTFPFSREVVDPLETLVTVTVSAEVIDGYDAEPGQIVVGVPDRSAWPVVKQLVGGGVRGTTYRLLCTATLSSGRVLVRELDLEVSR